MKLQNWRKVSFILAIFGTILFLTLFGFAMIFYAGGYKSNPSAPGYSIFNNYWSDLGRTVALSGENNLIAHVCFTLAMLAWGIAFGPSMHALPSLFSESKWGKRLSKIGIFSAWFCVITGEIGGIFFPEDLHPVPHVVVAVISYSAFFLVELLFAIVMYSDKNYPNKHAICFLAVAVAIVIYSMFVAPISQKAVTFTHAIATFIVFTDALKMIKKKENRT